MHLLAIVKHSAANFPRELFYYPNELSRAGLPSVETICVAKGTFPLVLVVILLLCKWHVTSNNIFNMQHQLWHFSVTSVYCYSTKRWKCLLTNKCCRYALSNILAIIFVKKFVSFYLHISSLITNKNVLFKGIFS